jgi:aspartate kinase
MPFQILKFGGTSMGTPESLQNVANILTQKLSNQDGRLIVVVSAMSGITDQLLNLAKSAKEKTFQTEDYQKIVDKHFQALENFGIDPKTTSLKPLLDELLEALTYKTLIEETTELAYYDLLASFGERLSANLLTAVLNKLNLPTEFVDARDFLVTDENYTNAQLNWGESRINWNQIQSNFKSKILIATGFIARSNTGSTTTLGRGGSDFTAGVMANLTDSKTVEIWTDVDGILSTDPRIVAKTKLIEKISYREAFEVAYYGGKVLYPKTIEAVMPKHITIIIKNTFYPENPGTSIIPDQTEGLKVVSLAKKITLVEVVFAAITSEVGLLGKIFTEFSKENLSVDVVTTSGDSVSFSCDKVPSKKLITIIENSIGPVTVWENQEIVAAIGADLNAQPTYPKILEIMSQVQPKMISMNTKNTNLTAVVNTGQGVALIKKIHGLIV